MDFDSRVSVQIDYLLSVQNYVIDGFVTGFACFSSITTACVYFILLKAIFQTILKF